MNKKAYIKGKGIRCPYCEAESVQGGFIHVDAGKAFQDMNCLECEGRWQEVYQLFDVIPYKEEK